MEQYIQAQLLKADLIEIDKELSKNGFRDMSSMLLTKHVFLIIANLVDFELTIRSIYRDYRDLSVEYKKAYREYEFAKYLRNNFIGHINRELIEKAIEWKPEIRYSLQLVNKDGIMFIFNLFILETAINTYVDSDGKHKMFDSDTDLMYQPDQIRFIKYLTTTVRSAIDYLKLLSDVLGANIEILSPNEQKLEHWLDAGGTNFRFLKKKAITSRPS